MGAGSDTTVLEPTTLTQTAAVAALALVALLATGAVRAALGDWTGGLQNWLLVLLGVNAGAGGLTGEALAGRRVVDMAALALAAFTFLGARPLLGRSERVWTAIAAALPLAGTAVLLATAIAGRSALMGAGLVLAWRMARRDGFRLLGWLGLTTNGLLLLADFGTTGAPQPPAADVVAVGYVLLLVWLTWLAARLLKPLRGRLVPVGVHAVAAGGRCRYGGTDTREVFELPLYSRPEGPLGTFVGVADEDTRFTVEEADVPLGGFLEAFDEVDGVCAVRVEEPGRFAAMTVVRTGTVR